VQSHRNLHLQNREISELLLVTRNGPSSTADQLGSSGVDIWTSGSNILNGELVERSGTLNVLESLCELPQLSINLNLRLLSILDSLSLEGLDALELGLEINGVWLEGVERGLDLVNNGLVLEDVAVLREIEGCWELFELGELPAGVFVALLEGREGGGSVALEAEGGGHLSPFNFESGATLWKGG
jgi:hypothetical protein